MLVNVAAKFVPNNGSFCTPEARSNEDRVRIDSPFHQRFGPGDGQFQVRTPHVQPEFLERGADIGEFDIREEDLGVDRGCGFFDLLLDPAVFRAAGELGDPYLAHGEPPSPSRNFRIAATNSSPSSSVRG